MTSDNRNGLQNKLNNSKKHNYFTIPAGIIAGVLLTLTPKQDVQAQSEVTPDNFEEFQSLYNEFQSIIHTSFDSTEEVETEEITEENGSLVVDHAEINLIKESLITAIEKAGATEIIEQLKELDLTIEQLETLFEDIVTQLVVTENAQDGLVTAIEVPNLEKVETKETAEAEVVEETVELEEVETEEVETEDLESEAVEEAVEVEEETLQPDVVEESETERPKVEEIDTKKIEETKEQVAPMVATASLATPETSYYVVKAGDNLIKLLDYMEQQLITCKH